MTDKEVATAKTLPAISDSAMLGSSAYLRGLFPEMSIDAEVGRQSSGGTGDYQLVDRLRYVARYGCN
ncbi:putative acyltransferase [Lacticaseibacillus paracasei subsp. paracasei Lpp123]|uniref:Putative acyltransferase n=1 Tax=Lacticaseibacillus paracasei subsp. paracasei Lpp123 TaxID=1256201 RepID=A0A829GBK7_LACPA|nr:putative acyltransferase [Lacticaseibacillus paracasei subsp. paracasei Lpp123]